MGEKQLVLQWEDVDLRHNNRAVIFFMGAYDNKKITWTCQYQSIMLYECCLYRHGIWIIHVQCSLAASICGSWTSAAVACSQKYTDMSEV